MPQTPPAAPSTPLILVVEDDALIAEAVGSRLRSEGLAVHIASDGLQAVQLGEQLRPDLVVLDLMLPGVDGLEVCRRLQATHPCLVLMLTAKDDEVDLLVGLRVGADDYMTKPFSPRELVARVHALLRRGARQQPVAPHDVRRIGAVRIDVGRRLVHDDAGAAVHLTATEFDLLRVLTDSPGQVRSRATLVREVWGYTDEAAERTVDSHIRAIRAKLGEAIIRTVRGVGYAAAEPPP